MRLPAAAAAACGGVEVMFPRDLDRSGMVEAMGCDVMVFQRPGNREIADLIPAVKARGVAVVVDIDDDLAALHPGHPLAAELDPRANRDINWQHVLRACRQADLVTVSTPALARRYGGDRARVLPNRVPERFLGIEGERDGRTVGWAGVTTLHVDDLTVTGGGVARAINETGARFMLIGKRRADAQRQLRLSRPPATIGFQPFERYPEQVARFDIGIAPLLSSTFNSSKSALKGLELAALGVPFVASPAPDYVRIHNDGIGILADRPADWHREIRRLLKDPAWAQDVAARGENAVARAHTLERNGWRWAEAWQEAADRRAGSRV